MLDVHVIGLGTMGTPIVARLRNAGHTVWVTDVNNDAVIEVAKKTGAQPWTASGSPEHINVLLLMLPNSSIVEAVLGSRQDPDSLMSTLSPTTIVLDMSSSDPNSTVKVAAELKENGVYMVDAPVSGGPVKAASGELAIMVGGAEDDSLWQKVHPLLSALGTNITRTGEVGSAHALKALNNLLSLIGIVGAIEVLQVGSKFGLDPSTMLDVLNHSTGRNHATEVKIGPQVLDRGWNVGFSLELTVKDVTTALNLAESGQVVTPVSEAAVKVAKEALTFMEGAKADQSQIAEYMESLNSVSLKR